MIFLDCELPNATTWFYASTLLAVALFFKFSRLLSVRNLDVVSLFLLVPGLLLVQEQTHWWWGYLCLLSGSFLLLIRCFLDLTLVQRPALSPNMALGGLAWLGLALFACLVVVTVNPSRPVPELGVTEPMLPQRASRKAEEVVEHQAQLNHVGEVNAHFWVGRGLAILCHLLVCAGLVFVGWRHFQDRHAGVAAATFYLLLPYTAAHFGQWYHVWPMALVVWAVAAYRKPTLAGLLLGLAAGTVYFPVLIFPTWWGFYRGRGTGRFTAAFLLALGICLGATALLFWMDGELWRQVESLAGLSAWQPWLTPDGGMAQSFWKGMPWAWAYRLPVFIGAMALVITTTFWPSPKNLAHVLALSAGAIISVQFWYANQGGVYILWYLPLVLLLVFRPNLSEKRPLLIARDTDWLFRLGRLVYRAAVRLARFPESPVRTGTRGSY